MYPLSFSNAPSALHDENSPQFLHSQHSNRLSHIRYEQSFTQQSLPSASAPYPYTSQPTHSSPSQYPYPIPPALQPVYPPLSTMPSRSSLRPVPQSLLNDPAFSTDPRANPHFIMTAGEQIVQLNPQAADLVSTQFRSTRSSLLISANPLLAQPITS